jgi:PAS domain S-box-containing protein
VEPTRGPAGNDPTLQLGQELARHKEQLAALRELHALSLRPGNEIRIFERLLVSLLTGSNSQHGFIAETHHRSVGAPFLKVRSTTRLDWRGRGPAEDEVELTDLGIPWAAALQGLQPIIALAHPPADGAPPPSTADPLTPPSTAGALLAAPILYDGVLVGVVTLTGGNRGYDPQVIADIQPLLETVAHFIATFRIEAARLSTELARAKALEEAERFRRLFELSDVLPMIAAINGQPLEFNERWTELLGWTADEVRAAPFSDLTHPEDLPIVRHAIARLRTSSASVQFEARLLHKLGGYRWLSWHARPAPEERRIYAVAVDVTARKLDEKRDADLLRTLQMAEEMSHVGWWSMDPETRAVVWSDEVYRILGRGRAEFRPTMETALSVYHPDDRHAVTAARDRAVQTGAPFRFECRVVRPGGEIRWVASYGRTEVDDEGVITQLFGVFQDVTDRHAADDELAKLAMVASRTSNAVIIANERTQIEWVNDAFTRLFGHSADDVRGRSPSEILLGPESNRDSVRAVANHVARGEGWKGEFVVYHRSGRPAWVELEVQPLVDAQGHRTRFMAILTDISERKKSEQELVRAREAALEASRVKSQFLANMSHEIRTPMNGVIGSAQLLLQTTLSAEQREYADAINNAGRVLLDLINDVLDISKIEAGRLELEHAAFSLRQVVEETQASFRPLIQRKGLTLSASFTDDLPLRHIGDAVRVRQILTNLLGNAIKFTASGGITIALQRHPDGIVYGTVRDTGIGIPQDRHAALFAPFVQADGSTTRRFGGTGLGLAITRELVRKMGGSIWFDSQTGEGTTFHFTLALTEALGGLEGQETAPAPSLVEPLPPARLDILLAEDNPVNAMVARRMLEIEGHKVTLAVNGKEAVEAAIAHEFDVVLMDVQMPVLDGLEATRQLRNAALPERRRLPIIALTANAMKGDRDLCIAAGMDAYLSKPLDPVALRRTVLELGRRSNDHFDRAALLTRVGGDLELAFLVAKTYVESHDRLSAQLQAAIAAGDLPAITRATRGLRGALGTVAAGAALNLAHQLEDAALASATTTCAALAVQLEAAVRHLADELTIWRLSPRSPPSGFIFLSGK